MNSNCTRAYLRLIFEDTLNNIQQDYLPNPFNELLTGLKQAMLKALDATEDQLVKINTQVNVWRDKLVKAWCDLKDTLSKAQQQYINETIMDLFQKYTTYMHGLNTGY